LGIVTYHLHVRALARGPGAAVTADQRRGRIAGTGHAHHLGLVRPKRRPARWGAGAGHAGERQGRQEHDPKKGPHRLAFRLHGPRSPAYNEWRLGFPSPLILTPRAGTDTPARGARGITTPTHDRVGSPCSVRQAASLESAPVSAGARREYSSRRERGRLMTLNSVV